MATIHRADLHPSKLDLVAGWLPNQPWYTGPAGDLERVAACRFDDPAGRVGIETFLVRHADGPIVHTPMTYRDAPLPGAEAYLMGTSEHSVLGTRWVYDACGDPVYAAAVAAAIHTGAGEAEELTVAEDGTTQSRPPLMTVSGSGIPGTPPPAVTRIVDVSAGDPSIITTDSVSLAVVRIVHAGREGNGPALTGRWAALTGKWAAQATPVTLATVVD
ncbi:CG0192-related protein [Hamadaea tsunoensis]|uniref:CG0192-related protein n=1 Tax=Hamadaea tsunoensis TaxID=53368 RepID=UPI0003F8433F|nr:hypothetical protein [Hamadaea tsunoensis]